MKLTIFNIALIIMAVLIILWLIKRTRVNKQKEKQYVEPLPFQPIHIEEVKDLYDGTELICKTGFLHYQLTMTNAVKEETEGLFVGSAKADPNHAARILIEDETNQLRGYIDNQNDLYKKLIFRKKTAIYGFSRKQNDDSFIGEVCVRIR